MNRRNTARVNRRARRRVFQTIRLYGGVFHDFQNGSLWQKCYFGLYLCAFAYSCYAHAFALAGCRDPAHGAETVFQFFLGIFGFVGPIFARIADGSVEAIAAYMDAPSPSILKTERASAELDGKLWKLFVAQTIFMAISASSSFANPHVTLWLNGGDYDDEDAHTIANGYFMFRVDNYGKFFVHNTVIQILCYFPIVLSAAFTCPMVGILFVIVTAYYKRLHQMLRDLTCLNRDSDCNSFDVKFREFLQAHEEVRGVTKNALKWQEKFVNYYLPSYIFFTIPGLLAFISAKETDNISIQMGVFTVFAFSVFIFLAACYVAQEFSDLNSNLLNEIYSLPWHESNPRRRRLLSIFMIRLQIPMEIKAFGMYAIHLSFFASIIRKIYSVVNLLLSRQ